jgi:restriction system protein
MGRRRKQASTSDVLLALPWWMLAIGSAASYLIFHNILPAAFAANPILSSLGMLARGLAWMPALLLAFFAVLSYLRERSQQADARHRHGPRHTEPAARRRDAGVSGLQTSVEPKDLKGRYGNTHPQSE